MSKSSRPTGPANLPRRHLLMAAASLGAGSLLAACGGGGGDGGTPTGGNETPAAFTSGPITGFGSVIVGGIRFDDSGASVTDEDGDSLSSRDDFKLGVVVEVDSRSINRTTGTAVALRIALGDSLVGPVGAVDSANSSFTLLGQTVMVTPSTVFDDSLAGGLAAIAAGDVLNVHALFDRANNRFVATRIEDKPNANEYRLRGLVSELNTTARTFKIGSELINYGNVSFVPPGLANGMFVRVRMLTAKVGGAWVATRLRGGLRNLDGRPEAHVEGVISTLRSVTDFDVNGLKVDASNAAFPDGRTGVVQGARVEVEGAIVGGVLVATKVELEERRDGGRLELEFIGTMSGLNTTAKTFALRGVTVWYGGTVEYRNGTEASLANDRRVEVKGVLAADRTRIEARRIEFK